MLTDDLTHEDKHHISIFTMLTVVAAKFKGVTAFHYFHLEMFMVINSTMSCNSFKLMFNVDSNSSK